MDRLSRLIVAQRPRATYDSVAGDQQQNGVACAGRADGAGTAFVPDDVGDLLIGGGGAIGNLLQRRIHLVLKGGGP